MEAPELGIIIPALNEAASIASVVNEVSRFGLAIVVDDGSSDRTGELARLAGAELVTLPHNEGYDRALDAGFRRARELGLRFAITFDADGQHDPEILPKMIGLLRAGNEFVTGIRQKPQRLAEHLFALYTRSCLGIQDPLCGLKGYHLSLYDKLGHFDRYGSIGTELALFAVKSGARFAEVPFSTRERRTGKPRFARSVRANWLIFRAMCLGMLIRGARCER